MSITKSQDRPIIVGTPIEIEAAVNAIRVELSALPWLSHPYFIAQRFFRKQNNKQFIYPETYAKAVTSDKDGKYPYHRLTPDGDYNAMCFFMVGKGLNDFSANEYNFIKYPVSIIFSANLEKIDKDKLDQGLFTQELIRDSRRIITDTMIKHTFHYVLKDETRDLQECYREFVLDDLEQYNRAPMQVWRLEMDVIIKEDCP